MILRVFVRLSGVGEAEHLKDDERAGLDSGASWGNQASGPFQASFLLFWRFQPHVTLEAMGPEAIKLTPHVQISTLDPSLPRQMSLRGAAL